MTENTKKLISAVVNGDIVKAKKATIPLLEADTSKKDERYCKQTLAKLQNEPMTMQLPTNISSFATMEDVSQTFIEKRYFLSERENAVFNEIVKVDKVGGKLAEKRIRHLNAVLLHGESGTGKTTFARYVAYKLGIPFLYLNFSHLISSSLGGTGKNIRHVFDFAKQQRCVLMLDELDAIGAERNGKNDVGEISRIVITLMQSLDLLGNDTIVLAATNRYDIIDKAVKRRFARNHEVKRLRPEERVLLGKEYLTDCGYDMTEESVMSVIGEAEKQSDIENRLVNYIIDRETEDFTKTCGQKFDWGGDDNDR